MINQHPRAPPGLEHGETPDTGGASSSGSGLAESLQYLQHLPQANCGKVATIEHEDTGGASGEKVGDRATFNQSLVDQGLAVPLPPQNTVETPEAAAHAEGTATEMAEVVLREDETTVETVETAASEVNNHPQAEEPATDKDETDLKNIVLVEQEETVLVGEKHK